jgi:hypothetical protein
MDLMPLTPIERDRARQRWMTRAIVLIVVALLIYVFVWQRTYPSTYTSDADHFKYGSIGSEAANGLPYWVFKALPKLYEEEFRGAGYRRFGMLYESDTADLPIGISKRTVQGIDRVWLNCAVCHVGTLKTSPQAPRQIILGAPSNELQLFEFIQFLRRVAVDNRFSAQRLIEAINSAEVGGDLGPLDRLFYRYIVFDRVRDGLLQIREQLAFMDRQRSWGPGRVDTFNPYKAIQFKFPMSPAHVSEVALNGSSDYPSIWQQAPRNGLFLHWDGNNPSVDERNLSAALGAGVTPVTIDHASVQRVRRWMWNLPAPKYSELLDQSIDVARATRGRELYQDYCAGCHGSAGSTGYDYSTTRHPQLGKVVPLGRIGTDRGRWASYTEAFAAAQNLLYVGYEGRFQNFRKTDGYANQPLDGIWAGSPYLHNGSVPTLRDLLEPTAQRPKVWYRGSELFDFAKVGYRADGAGESLQALFRYDTAVLGNSNSGHEGAAYGTELQTEDKDALVEYLKTL